jgi:hypothetical protein
MVNVLDSQNTSDDLTLQNTWEMKLAPIERLLRLRYGMKEANYNARNAGPTWEGSSVII